MFEKTLAILSKIVELLHPKVSFLVRVTLLDLETSEHIIHASAVSIRNLLKPKTHHFIINVCLVALALDADRAFVLLVLETAIGGRCEANEYRSTVYLKLIHDVSLGHWDR